MDAFARRWVTMAALLAFGTAGSGLAHEVAPRPAPQHGVPAAGIEPGVAAQPTMDPLVRALVIGIAASILREAASQPDPLEALGDAVERRAAAALADPNTLQLIDAAVQRAVRDAPAELREPLALFASSVARSLRRELLQDMPPYRPYY